MARPLRLEFAGALYHVSSRRDGQEAIYRADGDLRMFTLVPKFQDQLDKLFVDDLL